MRGIRAFGLAGSFLALGVACAGPDLSDWAAMVPEEDPTILAPPPEAEPIQRAVGVLVESDRIFVGDIMAKRVHAFERNGTYLWSVGGGTGEGPGELRSLGGMAAGPNGQLWMSDPMGQSLLTVDHEGSVTGTRQLPTPSGQFHVMPDGQILTVHPDASGLLGVLEETHTRPVVSADPEFREWALGLSASDRVLGIRMFSGPAGEVGVTDVRSAEIWILQVREDSVVGARRVGVPESLVRSAQETRQTASAMEQGGRQSLTVPIVRHVAVLPVGATWVDLIAPGIFGVLVPDDSTPGVIVEISEREEHRGVLASLFDGEHLYLARDTALVVHRVKPASR